MNKILKSFKNIKLSSLILISKNISFNQSYFNPKFQFFTQNQHKWFSTFNPSQETIVKNNSQGLGEKLIQVNKLI